MTRSEQWFVRGGMMPLIVTWTIAFILVIAYVIGPRSAVRGAFAVGALALAAMSTMTRRSSRYIDQRRG